MPAAGSPGLMTSPSWVVTSQVLRLEELGPCPRDEAGRHVEVHLPRPPTTSDVDFEALDKCFEVAACTRVPVAGGDPGPGITVATGRGDLHGLVEAAHAAPRQLRPLCRPLQALVGCAVRQAQRAPVPASSRSAKSKTKTGWGAPGAATCVRIQRNRRGRPHRGIRGGVGLVGFVQSNRSDRAERARRGNNKV